MDIIIIVFLPFVILVTIFFFILRAVGIKRYYEGSSTIDVDLDRLEKISKFTIDKIGFVPALFGIGSLVFSLIFTFINFDVIQGYFRFVKNDKNAYLISRHVHFQKDSDKYAKIILYEYPDIASGHYQINLSGKDVRVYLEANDFLYIKTDQPIGGRKNGWIYKGDSIANTGIDIPYWYLGD